MADQEKLKEIKLESGVFETRVTTKFGRRKLYEKRDPRVIKAVIPGVVAEISTKVGNAVNRGETIMILEAMKMLNRIMAPLDGSVKAICVKAGEKVTKGQVLIELE